MSESHQSRLARAEAFAVEAHGDQKYGVHPYRYHLLRVFATARDHDADEDVQVAAWLHDVIEDTPVTREQVVAEFGERVAELAWAVTDEPGDSREERKAATYPKIRSIYGAVTLKLCDRLANVMACFPDRQDKLDMYADEYAHFREELFDGSSEGPDASLWDVLDSVLHWPVESQDPHEHPAYREYRRRMAQEPAPGTSSRVALDELEQIGIWAGQWVRDHAPEDVHRAVLAELRAATAEMSREYWSREWPALRVLEATDEQSG